MQTSIQQSKLQLVQINAQINALNSQIRAETDRINRIITGAQVAVNPSNTEVIVATERIAQEKAGGESNKATIEKERQALVNQRIEIEKQLERDTSELK